MPLRCHLTISKLGSHNAAHSDAEQKVINDALEIAQAGTRRLGTLRNDTCTRQRQLEDHIHRCHIALAPFKKVPNEIWMYIFELYCQSGRLSTCNTIQPPVVLMQVCSAWRQIVLSMPKIWSDVHVGKRTDLVKMWLERAGNIPRALDSCRKPYYGCNNPVWKEEIMQIVCSFPFRRLHLEYGAAHIDFEKVPEKSLLPLEDLAIRCINYHGPHVISLNPLHCPNLSVLDIYSIDMPLFNVPNPFAMWKKLRVLRLKGVLRIRKCLDILSDAESVEDFTIQTGDYTGHPLRSIIHVNMKILTIVLEPSSPIIMLSISAIFDGLICPNLHTLILTSQLRLYTIDFRPLLSLVQRMESLRTLNLRCFHINVDINLVLEFLPLLEILELRCVRLKAKMEERIGKGELGGCLRELHDINSYNLYKLIRVCEIRRDVTQRQPKTATAIARLENVSVRYSEKVATPYYKRRIRKLLDDGIEFKAFENALEHNHNQYDCP